MSCGRVIYCTCVDELEMDESEVTSSRPMSSIGPGVRVDITREHDK